MCKRRYFYRRLLYSFLKLPLSAFSAKPGHWISTGIAEVRRKISNMLWMQLVIECIIHIGFKLLSSSIQEIILVIESIIGRYQNSLCTLF